MGLLEATIDVSEFIRSNANGTVNFFVYVYAPAGYRHGYRRQPVNLPVALKNGTQQGGLVLTPIRINAAANPTLSSLAWTR
jgi:hypothetical protein